MSGLAMQGLHLGSSKGLTDLLTYGENPRQDYSVPGKRKGDEKVQKQTRAQSVVNSSDYSRANQNT